MSCEYHFDDFKNAVFPVAGYLAFCNNIAVALKLT